MADDTAGDTGTQVQTIERSAGGEGALSPRDAANALLDARRKDNAGQRGDDEQQGEARTDATAQESASQEADTAQETGPGETQEADAQAETPDPIAPPRSWTKEDKELFKGLPRETQERLAERERSREADFLRRQNEAAEHTKGLTSKEQAAEQARAQYEQMLPLLLQSLQQQAGEFADIVTIADAERMASEDPFRFTRWQAQQMKVAGVQREIDAAQQRHAQEEAQRWNTFAKDEDAKFYDKAPDLQDPKVAAAVFQSASEMLKDLGFAPDEMSKLWNGQDKISLRDHRLQLLIRDGVRYREAQAKAKTAQQRPVPSVQRPGPAPARGADADERVKALDQRLTQTGSLRDAAAALVARRQASR